LSANYVLLIRPRRTTMTTMRLIRTGPQDRL
jgi:hypothetical protein